MSTRGNAATASPSLYRMGPIIKDQIARPRRRMPIDTGWLESAAEEPIVRRHGRFHLIRATHLPISDIMSTKVLRFHLMNQRP